MSLLREGIPASPGIVIGTARVLRSVVPPVPNAGSIPVTQIDDEIARFLEACDWSKQRLREIQQQTALRMGEMEARIFEPQIMMLEDPELVDGTIESIRQNHLSAERAFEWRILEWEARWSHSPHPMMLDRLNDLSDIQSRVLRRLLGMDEPDADDPSDGDDKVILVARDLTPSITAQLDPARVIGIATDSGTRTSHSAILARSLNIPAVVSLKNLSDQVQTGDLLIIDGRTGRVVVHPTRAEREAYRERDFQIREWEQELMLLAHLDAVTLDGCAVALRANIDQPAEAANARAHGAEGVGLYRTEFLVVGRNAFPGEDEQYHAYRSVAEAFANTPVIVRTYDLGGDKFPAFLHMPAEENPFLGWRAIRVCLDEPEMFRTQLRALLRSMVHGDVRIMLPLVNDIAEIQATRAMLDTAAEQLRAEGYAVPDRYSLGTMIETPAAAMTAPELARHVDFFSIGTNDLVQYTLAVDRGNSRLARLYNPFHPSVVRLIHGVIRAGEQAGIEVGVCGELAGHPLGAFMMIGMGADSLSVGPSALAEIKKVIRSVRQADAAAAVAEALTASTPDEVVAALMGRLRGRLDLSMFTLSWSLSADA